MQKKSQKSQNFNLKSFAVQEFSTKIYPCGTLQPPPPLRPWWIDSKQAIDSNIKWYEEVRKITSWGLKYWLSITLWLYQKLS